MASLTGTKIKDTYDSLLKVSDNGALDGTLQTITDGLGNDSALSLSTAGASVGGTLAVSGAATLSSTLGVSGAATLSSTLAVTGVSTLNSNVVIQPSNDADDTLRIYRGKDSGFEATSGVIDVKGGNLNIKSISNDSVRYISLKHSSNSGSSYSESARFYTTGDISFRDSSANEAFYWDASAASLGIGTPSPYGKLSVKTGTNENLHIVSIGAGDLRISALNDAAASTVQLSIQGSPLLFRTSGGAEAMRIDSSGNVGIGCTPSTKLDVQDGYIRVGSSANVTRDNTLLEGYGYTLSGTYYGLASIKAGYSNATNHSDLKFFTTGFDAYTERMRITSGGYLKASNSGSYAGASDSFHELRTSNGDWTAYISSSNASPYGAYFYFSDASPNNTSNIAIQFADSSAVRFRVYSNGNVQNTNNSYGAISDIKVKENIVDATPKLDKLMDVRVVNYNLIGDDKKQLGVVAQELEEVFPSMIDESPDYEEVEVPQVDENGQEVLDENGEVVMTKERVDLGTVTKSVKYSVFVPMLIKAIQEQQEIINDLKSRIEQLEA